MTKNETLRGRVNGRVKRWIVGRGFGFIAREGEQDVFVHILDLSSELRRLADGGQLEGVEAVFRLKQTLKGPQAVVVLSAEEYARREGRRPRSREDDIADAIAIAAVDKTVCAKCGTPLGRGGYVVETMTMTFALCENCPRPHGEPFDLRERSYQYGLLEHYSKPSPDGSGLRSSDEMAVFAALELGLEVTDGGGRRVLWAFGHSSGGWSGDGESAPSWYHRVKLNFSH